MRVIRRVNVRADDYYRAEQALLETGEAARPILERLLKDRDWVVRNRASDILSKMNIHRDNPNRSSRNGKPAPAADDF